MKATVVVMPKISVLDPQGVAVKNAVHSLGLDTVTGIRVGKVMEIELSGPLDAEGEKKLHGICRDLLSNPVIEDYELKLAN